MDSIIAFFQDLYQPIKDTLMNPEWIISHGGLYLVALIIFAETGLFIGFFLPGDGLLFLTGIIIAKTVSPFSEPIINLLFWIILITSSGIIGNIVGYWFGKKSGPLLFERRDTWIFKKRHIEQAREFYERRGGVAIIVARFLPVVRTFAPIIAGVVKMEYKKFLYYNFIGAIIWVGSLVTTGFLLGKNKWVENNLHFIILALVIVTTAPVLFKMIFGKKKESNTIIQEKKDEAAPVE
jgi:membrane-associated protein